MQEAEKEEIGRMVGMLGGLSSGMRIGRYVPLPFAPMIGGFIGAAVGTEFGRTFGKAVIDGTEAAFTTIRREATQLFDGSPDRSDTSAD